MNLRIHLIIGLVLSLAACSSYEPGEPETEGGPVIAAAPALPHAERDQYKQIVEHFVDSIFGNSRFNGSILVAKNGEIIFEKYTGYRDPRVQRDSITPATSFHLASVSKPLTAIAVLKLAEEGRLSLEDTVSKYLQGFPLPGVTVKSLLNHRSGIPNYVHYMDQMGWNRQVIMTNQDVLDFIIKNHKKIQTWSPDRRFSYSNTNYALLALVIEQVSGQTFSDYMRLSVFEPLGMYDTYVYTPADSLRALGSFFYNGNRYAFDFLDMVYGDKNIYSTPRDLLKFDQALNSGMFISPAILDSSYNGYSFEKKGINNYGLGWRLMLLPNGKKFIYHQGWWHGNRTAFYRMVDENATIIALSNNDYKQVYNTRSLADAFGNYFEEE